MMVISVAFCITIIPTIIRCIQDKTVQLTWLSLIPLWIGLWGMGSLLLIDGYYLTGTVNIINSFEWCGICVLKIWYHRNN